MSAPSSIARRRAAAAAAARPAPSVLGALALCAGLAGCTREGSDVPVPGAAPGGGKAGVPGAASPAPGAPAPGLPPGHPATGGGPALDPDNMPDDDVHRPLRQGAQPAEPLAAPPAAGVRFGAAPEGWVEERPSSSMRLRQLRLPRVEGDPEDGTVIVFFFGGAAGGVEANLERWVGQFENAGAPKVEKKAHRGFGLTFIELEGTFTAEMMPGAGDRQNKPAFMLQGAIVEAQDGNYFVKGTGPAATMQRWRDAFRAFVESVGAR